MTQENLKKSDWRDIGHGCDFELERIESVFDLQFASGVLVIQTTRCGWTSGIDPSSGHTLFGDFLFVFNYVPIYVLFSLNASNFSQLSLVFGFAKGWLAKI